MIVSFAVLLVFAFVGLLGLLAAKLPQVCVRHFLVGSQRERLEGNFAAVSRTGWIVFGLAAVTVIAMLVSGTVGR